MYICVFLYCSSSKFIYADLCELCTKWFDAKLHFIEHDDKVRSHLEPERNSVFGADTNIRE